MDEIPTHQLRFTKVNDRAVVDVEDLLTLLRWFASDENGHNRKVRAACEDAADFLLESWLHLTDPRA